MSADETVFNLLDVYWFERGVFTPNPPLSRAETAPVSEAEPKLNRVATLMRKSYSDEFLSSKDDSDSPSPTSVLGPHLQTILSGKEVDNFEDSPPKRISVETEGAKPERRRRRRKSSRSRSLSELEFDELKGFMDLGFVFSDEDKDSRLVSIIPGLQREGKNLNSVSRPYLSEAWEKDPLVGIKISGLGNEMELKQHIRCWAHSVASAVR